jgi:hypothetical protein
MAKIDVHAPTCAGNLIIGSRNCPKCGVPLQITIEHVRGSGSSFVLVCSCGSRFTGNLTPGEQHPIQD